MPAMPMGVWVASWLDMILSWLESILSSPAGSMDGFILEPLLDADFWILKLELEALESLGGVITGLGSSGSGFVVAGALPDEPQLHFCFRGMAAVTAPHEHEFDEG